MHWQERLAPPSTTVYRLPVLPTTRNLRCYRKAVHHLSPASFVSACTLKAFRRVQCDMRELCT